MDLAELGYWLLQIEGLFRAEEAQAAQLTNNGG